MWAYIKKKKTPDVIELTLHTFVLNHIHLILMNVISIIYLYSIAYMYIITNNAAALYGISALNSIMYVLKSTCTK